MSQQFSPFELKHLRNKLRASLARMAELLGLSGDTAAEAVRKMENDDKILAGPIQRIARYMQQGLIEGDIEKVLPAFMICSDLQSVIEYEWIFHTQYPRFLAVVTDENIGGDVCSVSHDGLEWVSVALWIDEPVSDPGPLLEAAGQYFLDYTKSCSK